MSALETFYLFHLPEEVLMLLDLFSTSFQEAIKVLIGLKNHESLPKDIVVRATLEKADVFYVVTLFFLALLNIKILNSFLFIFRTCWLLLS